MRRIIYLTTTYEYREVRKERENKKVTKLSLKTVICKSYQKDTLIPYKI